MSLGWFILTALLYMGMIAARGRAAERFLITVTSEGLSCATPAEGTFWIAWQELLLVLAIRGERALHWIFVDEGRQARLAIPSGASGEDQMLDALRRLPGFDVEALDAALLSREPAQFVLWRNPVPWLLSAPAWPLMDDAPRGGTLPAGAERGAFPSKT
ncbi:MAG: hypothetical protein U0167_07700 [bacterium]